LSATIFGNESLPLWAWPWLVGGGIAFFLVVELEKLAIRSSPTLREAATQLSELQASSGVMKRVCLQA
jgi:hypothetical protein